MAKPSAGGGSPAWLSWLPRTSTSSTAAWRLRQQASAASTAGLRASAACRKSPSTTSRRTAGQKKGRQPLQVALRGARRHGNAVRAEGGGLAQVQVGDEQRALGGPPQRMLGQQVHGLAGQEHAQAAGQGVGETGLGNGAWPFISGAMVLQQRQGPRGLAYAARAAAGGIGLGAIGGLQRKSSVRRTAAVSSSTAGAGLPWVFRGRSGGSGGTRSCVRGSLAAPPASAASCSWASMRAMRSARCSLVSFSRKRSTMSGKANGLGRRSALTTSVCACMRRNAASSWATSSSWLSTSSSAWRSSRLLSSYLRNTSKNSCDEACSWRALRRSPGWLWKIRPETRAISRKRRRAISVALRLASTSCSRAWRA